MGKTYRYSPDETKKRPKRRIKKDKWDFNDQARVDDFISINNDADQETGPTQRNTSNTRKQNGY